MKKADQKIISENPGLTPYELSQKGLSQSAYEELMEKESHKPHPQVAQPTSIQKVTMAPVPHKPQISQPQAATQNVNLLNKQTGKVTSMSRRMAEQMARSTPQQFQIVS